MKKIKIFLASSAELKADREAFEIAIYRKTKMWIDEGIFLHLDVWEDLTDALSQTHSQDEYNKAVKAADVFVLLAYTKVGMYTAQEFEQAFGQFKETNKPFIFAYFKDAPINTASIDDNILSLLTFKKKLGELGYFYPSYKDSNDLIKQFVHEELDRLKANSFAKLTPHHTAQTPPQTQNNVNVQGNNNAVLQGIQNSTVQVHTGTGHNIGHDKIGTQYKIGNIDNAKFE
jgi:hypothetical protein